MLTIFMKQLVFIKEIWKIIRLLNDKIVSFLYKTKMISLAQGN